MANYTVTDLELTSIANAIRTKGGTSTSLAFPSEFVSAINDISTGVNEDGYIQKTIQQVSNSTASYVARQAFFQCLSLESVRMENVTTISSTAFAGCVQLSNVCFPKCEYIDYYAFESTKITEVTSNNFPALERVDIQAFYACSLLSRVILNNVVSFTGNISSQGAYCQFFSYSPIEYIEMNALSAVPSYLFRFMSSLRSASFASATSIGSYAFCSAANLESITTGNLTDIGSYAFAYAGFKELSVSEYINVGTAAFAGNKSLSRAYIPFSDSVPSSLFTGCSSLSSIYFGEATVLGSYCFNGTAISDFSGFPVLTSIGVGAFGNTTISRIPPNTCKVITGFQYCNNLTTISDSDFPYGTTIGSSAFRGCEGLTDVSFSNMKTINGGNAFTGCSSLVNVSLPSLQDITYSVFQSCKALSQISLPNLQYVPQYAFHGCDNLQTAYFPKVSMINSNAFVNCFNLVSLYLGNSSIVDIGSLYSVFRSSPIYGYSGSAGHLGKVYVPESLVTTYKNNAKWREISNRIEGYSF